MVLPLLVGILRGAAMFGGEALGAEAGGFLGRIGMRAQISGLDEAKQGIDQLQQNMSEENIRHTIQEWIDNSWKPHAKRIVPVKTGHLKSKIDGHAHGYGAELKADTDYAGYVEEGTSRMHAQPFMEPSVRAELPKLQSKLGKNIMKGVKHDP